MDVSKLDLFGGAENEVVSAIEPEVKKRLFKGLVFGDYESKEHSLQLKTTNNHYLSLFRGLYFQISNDSRGNGSCGSGSYPYFRKNFSTTPSLLKKWLELGAMDTLHNYFQNGFGVGIEVDLKNLPTEDRFLLDSYLSYTTSLLLENKNLIHLNKNIAYPNYHVGGSFNADGVKITSGHGFSTTIEFQGKSSTFPVLLSYEGNATGEDKEDFLYDQFMLLVFSFQHEQGRSIFDGTPLEYDLYTPFREVLKTRHF